MRSARADAAAAFAAVDRVIQTGQDPRRFVEDLLERLRDLIVVAATSDNAASVMRGIPQDQLDRMATQAAAFGQAELSRSADVINTALTEMTGATSPRLHLELMWRACSCRGATTPRGARSRASSAWNGAALSRPEHRPDPARGLLTGPDGARPVTRGAGGLAGPAAARGGARRA